MRIIYLPNDKQTIVDDSDYEFLSRYRWWVTSKGYVAGKTQGGKNGVHLMHRIITLAPRDRQVDHMNNNKLDNRRINLRFATGSQNQSNRGVQANSSTGYKGVSYEKSIKRYRAYIWKDRKRYCLKTFKTPEEAALAYNKKAMELHGEFAVLNNITIHPTTPPTRTLA